MGHICCPPFHFQTLPFVARYECMPRALSEIGIWDIPNRGAVRDRDEIEAMQAQGIKGGLTAIRPPGLPPMAIDRWVAILLGRWNRKILTQLSIDAFRRGPPEWYAEARDVAEFKTCSLEVAVEAVALRYLDHRDLQPLLALLGFGYVPTTKVLRRHLADMLSANSHRLYIGINLVRAKTGPKTSSNSEDQILVVLGLGAERLAIGKDPGRQFWDYFRALFDKDQRPTVQQKWKLRDPFSVDGWIEHKEQLPGNVGDRKKLGLVVRDKMLTEFVQRRLDKRELVKNAPLNVSNAWNAEAIKGQKVKEPTVAAAYKEHKPPRARKPGHPPRARKSSRPDEGKISPWSTEKDGVLKRTKTRE
jgi:hypothetical protein